MWRRLVEGINHQPNHHHSDANIDVQAPPKFKKRFKCLKCVHFQGNQNSYSNNPAHFFSANIEDDAIKQMPLLKVLEEFIKGCI